MDRPRVPLERKILTALVLYASASFFHHAHNAAFLSVYPNMPEGLSILGVYAAWAVVSLIGLAGYGLWRAGYRGPALLTLAVYGASGLDGLAHYVVAEFSAHTFLMHVSILFEALTGVMLIVACGWSAFKTNAATSPD